jgi:hypothetical protein
MANGYTVTHLRPSDAEQSYPLLYGAAPAVILEKWKQFCAGNPDLSAPTCLLVRNEDGYIHGLAVCYEVEHLSRGRLIDVPIFLVASAADPAGVADTLAHALRRLCAERVCAAVRVTTPATSWTDSHLLRHGEMGDDDAVYFPSAP